MNFDEAWDMLSYNNEYDAIMTAAKKGANKLKKKYPNKLILFRGWDTKWGNRGTKADLSLKGSSGLFFADKPNDCLDYGDTIKVYLADDSIKLFRYSDSQLFIEKEHPELMDYTDKVLADILANDYVEDVPTYNGAIAEYDGCPSDASLHAAEYLAWLVLKDNYDGAIWEDVVYSNYCVTDYQIWNLNKLTEIDVDKI